MYGGRKLDSNVSPPVLSWMTVVIKNYMDGFFAGQDVVMMITWVGSHIWLAVSSCEQEYLFLTSSTRASLLSWALLPGPGLMASWRGLAFGSTG